MTNQVDPARGFAVTDETEEVTFAPIDDVLEGLQSIPGIEDDRMEREAAREKMEKSYRMSLAMVRHAGQLTQVDVAQKMGRTQASISRTEKRGDMLLSTLREYLEAAGVERSRILVTIHGVEHEIELDAFDRD